METAKFIKLYFISLLTFFAVDMVWLGLIAKNFYEKYLGFIMSKEVNWVPAIIFYLIFIFALVIFVVIPGIDAKSISKTIGLAIMFGLVTYATYDLTNLATLKNWPLIVTIIDLIWGITLSTIVSSVTFFIGKNL